MRALGGGHGPRWTTAHIETSPLVPRLRLLMLFRIGAVLTCLAMQFADRADVPTSWSMQVFLCGGWILLTSGMTELGSRVPRVFAVMALSCGLLADGVFLQAERIVFAASIAPLMLTGAAVVAVTLLSSLRGGILAATWTSLLMLLVHRASVENLLPNATLSDSRLLQASLLSVWGLVVTTAAFASVNERELRRRRRDAELLNILSTRLSAAGRGADVGAGLVTFMTETLKAHRAIVVCRDRMNLRLLAVSGDGIEVGQRPRPGSSGLLMCFEDYGPYRLVSKVNPDDEPWLDAVLPGAKGLVVLPLAEIGDGSWLVFEVGNSTRLDPRVLSAARQANSAAGLALQRVAVLEQLERAAHTDGLTGLANRRHFDETLSRLIEDARRTGEPFALAIADVDHFKRVNDTHGHLTGDRALAHVARVLADSCRAQDIPARYGGEEFALLMPGTTIEQAAIVCERFRTNLQNAKAPLTLTASVGVAALPPHPAEPAALISCADSALLEAKRSGRNRVLTAAATAPFARPVPAEPAALASPAPVAAAPAAPPAPAPRSAVPPVPHPAAPRTDTVGTAA